MTAEVGRDDVVIVLEFLGDPKSSSGNDPGRHAAHQWRRPIVAPIDIMKTEPLEK